MTHWLKNLDQSCVRFELNQFDSPQFSLFYKGHSRPWRPKYSLLRFTGIADIKIWNNSNIVSTSISKTSMVGFYFLKLWNHTSVFSPHSSFPVWKPIQCFVGHRISSWLLLSFSVSNNSSQPNCKSAYCRVLPSYHAITALNIFFNPQTGIKVWLFQKSRQKLNSHDYSGYSSHSLRGQDSLRRS